MPENRETNRCPECGKQMNSREEMERHIQNSHPGRSK